MSEWSIEHAWKLAPLARAEAHQIPPTHVRSTISRDTDVRPHVPVNGDVALGFRGVSDTVLTQCEFAFTRTHIRTHRPTTGRNAASAANRLSASPQEVASA